MKVLVPISAKPAIFGRMTKIKHLPLKLLAILALALPVSAVAAPGESGLSSAWVKGPHTRARIVAMPWDGRAPLRLGVQLELEPGWKTYWRNPGDAGIPPRFSWKGSDNIKPPRMLWPAPERMADEFGVSIGYKHGALLPVRIEASRRGEPVKLALEVNYGVCAEVCIPVTTRLKLELAPGSAASGPHDALIAKWQSRVPGPAAKSGLDIVSLKPFAEKDKTGFEVTIAGKGGLRKPVLFVEGPGKYYFSVPEMVSQSAGRAVYRFEVDDVESPAELKGNKLTFTLSDKTRAAEREWILE